MFSRLLSRLRAKWPFLNAFHISLFGAALLLSTLLHGALLVTNFVAEKEKTSAKDRGLDVVLVNSKSARKPLNAQVLAQANVDAGGNTDADRRATTPLPVSAKQQQGNDLERAKKRVQELEVRQKRLLTQAKSTKNIAPTPKPAASEPREAPTEVALPNLSGQDLANSALEMARLEAEIARTADEYNKRPRVKNIGTRAEEYRFAQYIEDWRLKVERVGTLNYPEAAKGKLSGNLALTVRIKNDGSVEKIEIDRSSGHKILDDAARRIVQMASPYATFPPGIARDTDVLEISRTWSFTSENVLQTKAR